MITCWIDRFNEQRVSSALASIVGHPLQLIGDRTLSLYRRRCVIVITTTSRYGEITIARLQTKKINFKKYFYAKLNDRKMVKKSRNESILQ